MDLGLGEMLSFHHGSFTVCGRFLPHLFPKTIQEMTQTFLKQHPLVGMNICDGTQYIRPCHRSRTRGPAETWTLGTPNHSDITDHRSDITDYRSDITDYIITAPALTPTVLPSLDGGPVLAASWLRNTESALIILTTFNDKEGENMVRRGDLRGQATQVCNPLTYTGLCCGRRSYPAGLRRSSRGVRCRQTARLRRQADR